jgi:glyoxylase-like metal-dependent hydrolase (beta-lactamase superfamily II)
VISILQRRRLERWGEIVSYIHAHLALHVAVAHVAVSHAHLVHVGGLSCCPEGREEVIIG